MGFYQVCLELNSHWVFHIAGSIFSSPHPVCLRTCWGVGSRGCPKFGGWNQLWQSHRSVAKFFLHIPGFGNIEECSHHPKKKHSTVAGGLRRTTFLLRLPKFSVSGPHEILGVSAFQPFFVPPQICAGPPGRSTDQRHRMSLILHPLSKVKGLQFTNGIPRQPTQVRWWRETKGGEWNHWKGGNSA